MSEKNRNITIAAVLIIALALLLTNPTPIYAMLGVVHTIAATVFYIVATIWIVRKL